MRSVLRFLNKETASLHRAAYLIAGFSLLSQVLAFFRDRLLAHVFGASAALDSYYAAFRIPDFLFVTVASLVSLSVVVPFIAEREKRGKESVREFVDDVFTWFSIFIVAVSAVAFFLIPWLAPLLFKGFSGAELARVILLSRVFLLSPIFLGMGNLLGSLTQAYNRFLAYAAAPLFYNLGIILGTLILAPRYGVLGVAIGVVSGSLLNMAFQVPFVAGLGLLPRLRLGFGGQARRSLENVRRVFTLSVPRTLSLSVNHIAQIFLVSLASLMPVGSISIYSFALNIQSVPLSIIGVSYSLAAFPTLARRYSSGQVSEYVGEMARTARHVIFWSLPATALFIALRFQLVRVLLGSGRFDAPSMRLTAAALAVFSISALAQSLLLLFTRGFYAAGHTKKPFLINVTSAGVTIALAYAFTKLFHASAVFRLGFSRLWGVSDLEAVVLMLPLGYAVGTILNGLAHWVGFERDFGSFTKPVIRTFWESLAAAVVIGLVSHEMLGLVHISDGSFFGALTHGLASGLIGIVAGFLVLWLLGSRELGEAFSSLRLRFSSNLAVSEPQEIDSV